MRKSKRLSPDPLAPLSALHRKFGAQSSSPEKPLSRFEFSRVERNVSPPPPVQLTNEERALLPELGRLDATLRQAGVHDVGEFLERPDQREAMLEAARSRAKDTEAWGKLMATLVSAGRLPLDVLEHREPYTANELAQAGSAVLGSQRGHANEALNRRLEALWADRKDEIL